VIPRRGQAHALALAAIAVLALLAGCAHHPAPKPSPSGSAPAAPPPKSGSRYSQDRDSIPSGPPPDVSKIPEPVPKAEPRAQYGNKSPYSVLGESYRVLPEAKGYVERGIASWYGNKFHGFTTSTFEKYDMYAYSAAHKTLPLPSYAQVTNLENGRTVIVRVNDRGPFVQNRIIDLSYVAAVKLGVWPKGTAMVEVRAIDPDNRDKPLQASSAPGACVEAGRDRCAHHAAAAAPKAPEPASPHAVSSIASGSAPEKTPKPALYLQVGAYGDRINAERAASTLRAARLGDVRIVAAEVNGKSIQRVRLGPLKDVDETDRLTPAVRALGLGEPRVAIED